jgi:hypothetical protein
MIPILQLEYYLIPKEIFETDLTRSVVILWYPPIAPISTLNPELKISIISQKKYTTIMLFREHKMKPGHVNKRE